MSRKRRRATEQSAGQTNVDDVPTAVSGGNLAGYDVTYAAPPARRKLSAPERFMAELRAERGWYGGGGRG